MSVVLDYHGQTYARGAHGTGSAPTTQRLDMRYCFMI